MPGGLLNSGTKLAGCRIGGSSIEHENHNAISKFCKAITKRSECKSNLEKREAATKQLTQGSPGRSGPSVDLTRFVGDTTISERSELDVVGA